MPPDISFLAWWVSLTIALYLSLRLRHHFRWRLLLQANSYLRAGKYERALEAAEMASTRYPGDWQPLVTGALACLSLHDPARALELCNKATTVAPKHAPELYYSRAYARAALMEGTGALEDANRALAQKRSYESLLARAYVYGLQFRFSEALADCNEAINMNPKHSLAYTYRCWMALELNDVVSATADCDKLVKSLTNNSTPSEVAAALSLQARLHWINANFAQAIEDLSKAIDLDSSGPSSYINRAFCLSVTKELERAAIDLTQAETLTKSNRIRSFISSYRARIAILKNDLAGALVLAEEAVALSERPSSLCTRAAVLLLTGQFERAEQDLDKALQLDPCCAETYWWKGRLLESLGKREDGEASKQKALEWHYTPYF